MTYDFKSSNGVKKNFFQSWFILEQNDSGILHLLVCGACNIETVVESFKLKNDL